MAIAANWKVKLEVQQRKDRKHRMDNEKLRGVVSHHWIVTIEHTSQIIHIYIMESSKITVAETGNKRNVLSNEDVSQAIVDIA